MSGLICDGVFFVVPCVLGVLGVLSQKAVSLGRESQSVCVRRSRSLGLFAFSLSSLPLLLALCLFALFSFSRDLSVSPVAFCLSLAFCLACRRQRLSLMRKMDSIVARRLVALCSL